MKQTHQHIGINGVPCGAEHPIAEKHRSLMTRLAHNFTVSKMSDITRELKRGLTQWATAAADNRLTNPVAVRVRADNFANRRRNTKRDLRIIRRRNIREMAQAALAAAALAVKPRKRVRKTVVETPLIPA